MSEDYIHFSRDKRMDVSSYLKNKRIEELFEALMTGLMVHQPNDHIEYIHQCLDQIEFCSESIHWNSFVSHSSIQYSSTIHRPVVFLLSSIGCLNLCARLLDRYDQMTYIAISNQNDDNDEKMDKREEMIRIRRSMKRNSSQTSIFLLAATIDEKDFLAQWLEQLGRIDLIFVLSETPLKCLSVEHLRTLALNSDDDMTNILSMMIRVLDEIVGYRYI